MFLNYCSCGLPAIRVDLLALLRSKLWLDGKEACRAKQPLYTNLTSFVWLDTFFLIQSSGFYHDLKPSNNLNYVFFPNIFFHQYSFELCIAVYFSQICCTSTERVGRKMCLLSDSPTPQHTVCCADVHLNLVYCFTGYQKTTSMELIKMSWNLWTATGSDECESPKSYG